jgi:hypothetical protein
MRLAATRKMSNANRRRDRAVCRSSESTPVAAEPKVPIGMEVVLLWLDDLDDVLFSAALVWERLRRIVLQIGLAAAFALAASELSAIATHWWAAFTAVAGASVGTWLLGATLRALYYRRAEGALTAA